MLSIYCAGAGFAAVEATGARREQAQKQKADFPYVENLPSAL
jgi:hypothetical protein